MQLQESAAERRMRDTEAEVRLLVDAARPDAALRDLLGKIADAEQEVARAKVDVLLAGDHELIDLDKAECFSADDKAMILGLVANDQPSIVALIASLIRDNVCQSAVHDRALPLSGDVAVDLSRCDLDAPLTLLAFAAWLRTVRPATSCLTMHITTESCTFLRRAMEEGTLPRLQELRLTARRLSDEAKRELERCCASKRATITWQAEPTSQQVQQARGGDVSLLAVLASMGFSDAEATSALALARPPSDAEQLREWYQRALRAQHAHISDALSGRRLGALTECVSIQLTGIDQSGAPLNVRDAAGLSSWMLTEVHRVC